MSDKSSIEWTDATWNPVRGCTKLSPGCKHCYAKTFAERFKGVEGHAYELGFDLRIVPEKLAEPLKWATPKMVFVNSMSDLFHHNVPTSYIEKVVEVMGVADWHTFQVLTKRSERMMDFLNGPLKKYAHLAHIWWGVSVEDRKFGLPRISHLQQSAAKVRFLSIEPLLEELGLVDFGGIAWAIVGGESGFGARPMRPEWVRSLREQCENQKVAFFFKQWGGRNKKKTGRVLDGQTFDAFPTIEREAVPDRYIRTQHLSSFQSDAKLISITL